MLPKTPSVVEHIALIDPRGVYCGDSFIADALVQRRDRVSLVPLGNVYIARAVFEVYKRSGHDRMILL